MTHGTRVIKVENRGNNKITELRTILQRESQNPQLYKQTKSKKIRSYNGQKKKDNRINNCLQRCPGL